MKEQHKHILQNTALLSIGSTITKIGYTDISRATRYTIRFIYYYWLWYVFRGNTSIIWSSWLNKGLQML
jgi:hypothetical protein